MGILANTLSFCQFRVEGAALPADLASWAGESLRKKAFRSIEHSTEEESIGWVELLDNQSSEFASPQSFHKDRFLAFSLRKDQRRLPAALIRRGVQKRSEAFLQEHPGLKRVPKGKKEEILDLVRGELLARTFPVPAIYDAVWDLDSNRVYFAGLNAKLIELFENLFKTSFEGLRLVSVHPMNRAESLLDEAGRKLLAAADRSGAQSVLDQMRENRWLGTDFLLWLLFETLCGSGDYATVTPGFELEGHRFAGYLNDRLVLVGGGDEGVQKITAAGPQDRFHEVRTALAGGKEITEATLYLEKAEESWKLNLKAESFHFGSFRCPSVTLEKDDRVNEDSEKEAVFLERMLLLEQGLQCFDSLFATFLKLRLDEGWPKQAAAVEAWLNEAREA